MSLKAKTILSFLGFAIFGFLVFVVFLPYFSTHYLHSEVSATIYDGWTLELTATKPVSVLAYSSNAKAGSRLLDEAGNVVLETLPETTPGNFAAKGTLKQGVYTLGGDRTTLEFSGEGFVGLDNPREREVDQKMGWIGWGMFVLMISLLFSWEYCRNTV